MIYENNPVSIKYYVKRYLLSNKEKLVGKKVIDFPAGNGITSKLLLQIGAQPFPFDLFPEYFKLKDLECKRVNIKNEIPIENNFADFLICQEGIEHFSDQLRALKSFNRVLKAKGTLLLTTPNYSNLRAKLSYLLSESERFGSMMPPNELDSVWMSDQEVTDEIYYGHIFLTGIQKLRALAKLSGFRITKIIRTRTKPTSVILFPFLYPFIWIVNRWALKTNMRNNTVFNQETKKKVYHEMFKLSVNTKVLTSSHLMIEFEKEIEIDKIPGNLKNRHKNFGLT